MFTDGLSYTFFVDEFDGATQATYKVLKQEGALLTLSRHGISPFILNTASSRFLKAVPAEHDADAELVISFTS